MLLAGDEIGRTQLGNNNSYCQDSEISWIDWDLTTPRRELLEFTQFLIRLFHDQPVLHRQKFFHGRKIRGSEVKDLTWFRPDGKEMTEENWNNPETRCFGLRLSGEAIDEVDQEGNPITGDTLLLLLNAHYEPLSFILPAHKTGLRWELRLDTRTSVKKIDHRIVKAGKPYGLESRSLVLFRLENNHSKDSHKRPNR